MARSGDVLEHPVTGERTGVDGKTNSKGLPNRLSMAVLMREYDAEVQLARPPAVVQRALFAPLALVGRTLGLPRVVPAQHVRADAADPLIADGWIHPLRSDRRWVSRPTRGRASLK